VADWYREDTLLEDLLVIECRGCGYWWRSAPPASAWCPLCGEGLRRHGAAGLFDPDEVAEAARRMREAGYPYRRASRLLCRQWARGQVGEEQVRELLCRAWEVRHDPAALGQCQQCGAPYYEWGPAPGLCAACAA
jgi:hypothetical protein